MLTAMGRSFLVVVESVRRRGSGGTGAQTPAPPPARIAGLGTKKFGKCSGRSGLGARGPIHHGVVESRPSPAALEELAAEIQASAWELALAVVEEGLLDDQIPSLQRLGRLGQLGDMPTFICELARELVDPQPERMRRGSPLAAQAREHARQREALGFAPREIVTEFLLLRRVLWAFVARRSAELELDASRCSPSSERLNATIDRLVTECVVAYFDRATSELAHQARHDQLTGLLHHQAFVRELELELERAAPLRPRRLARLPRPRPLQGDQRHARPPRRRPGAAAARRAPARVAARLRPRRADGRRRVRRVPRRGRRGGRRAAGRPPERPRRRAGRQRGAAGARARSAPASRTSPTRPPTPTRSSASPTGASTSRSAPARPEGRPAAATRPRPAPR